MSMRFRGRSESFPRIGGGDPARSQRLALKAGFSRIRRWIIPNITNCLSTDTGYEYIHIVRQGKTTLCHTRLLVARWHRCTRADAPTDARHPQKKSYTASLEQTLSDLKTDAKADGIGLTRVQGVFAGRGTSQNLFRSIQKNQSSLCKLN